ncbi:MAG: SOS response-associated peptidase [Clostridia bacterium]|nr:SOS response-associated peptidase [Clostridia bacterium]
MCGRYSFAPDLKIVNEHYNIMANPADVTANYNAAPTQLLPVISNETPRQLSLFRWGLVPFWAKDASIGNKLINARAESLDTKPSFRNAFKNRRCLVPADAFYEWKKAAGGKTKIPYRISIKNQPLFSMAGIWEQWKNPAGELLQSFSIVTTVANELVAGLHNRMPVILPPEAEHLWLSDLKKDALLALLQPFDAGAMELYPVSTLLNSARNNSKELIARSANYQEDLFSGLGN